MTNSSTPTNKIPPLELERLLMPPQEPEIDIDELVSALLKRIWLIIGFTFLASLITLLQAFALPNQYKSETLLVPVNTGLDKSLASLALTSLLSGARMPKEDTTMAKEAILVLKSRQFIHEFIQEHQLKPLLFPELWDASVQQWRIPEPGYLTILKQALSSQDNTQQEAVRFYEGQEKLAPGEPSSWQAVKRFNRILRVVHSDDMDKISVSIEWFDPLQARDWTNRLIVMLNQKLRQESIEKSKKRIRYLEEQLARTALIEIREIMFNIIEENIKSMTLASTQPDYVFKVIDPAVVAEDRSSPNRSLMVAAAFVLSFIFSVLLALILHWFEKRKLRREAAEQA